jgi:radical SAM superfamily enzyme YgiQ (UPF0313 family)
MKIIFIYPRWTGDYGLISGYFARKSGGIVPPLNLGLLAAIGRQGGHDVSIIDAEIDRINEEDLVTKVIEQNPDLVTLSGMSPFFHLSKSFAESLKKVNPNLKILLGGQHFTIEGKKAFYKCFDYGYCGECENQLLSLLKGIENEGDLSDILGLYYRNGKEVIYTGTNTYIRDLDSLPFPARDLLPMHKYKVGTLRGRLNFTTIHSMRGCPWHCIFCASDKLNTTLVSRRSPESIIEEIKQVINDFGIKHFLFTDDVLTLYFDDHLKIICEKIIEERLNITFEGNTRANLIKEEMIELMSRAGLIRLSFGLETVDTEMRKTMKKQVPLKHYSNANRILNKYNVEAANSVMLGLPGETRETIKKTLDYLRNDSEVKMANFAIAIPYPGTEFHEIASAGHQGMELISDDFSEYKRYGSAITNVGDLSAQDLVDLQNKGFVSIYSKPHRWKSVIKKNGIFGGILMLLRVFKLIMTKHFKIVKRLKFKQIFSLRTPRW